MDGLLGGGFVWMDIYVAICTASFPQYVFWDHPCCKVFHHFLWLNGNPLYHYNTTNLSLCLSGNTLAFVDNTVINVTINLLFSVAVFLRY